MGLQQKHCRDYDLTMSNRAWVDLDKEDFRGMLFNLIGYRFGPRPEEHLDQIRKE
jgi:hypothetical protein